MFSLEGFERVAGQGGDVIPFAGDGRRSFLITSPRMARELLADSRRCTREGAPSTAMARRLFGRSMISTFGPFHARQRRLYQAAMTSRSVAAFDEVAGRSARRLAERWLAAPAAPVDVHDEMTSTTRPAPSP